jgi:hypothetical protein
MNSTPWPTAPSTPNSPGQLPSACWPNCPTPRSPPTWLFTCSTASRPARRRGALAHLALCGGWRAADGGVSPTTASAPWWWTKSWKACAKPPRRRGRHLAADRPVRARRHLGQTRPHRNRARHGQYTVIEHDGVIFGCAALYPYPEARTAEMAALTVSPQCKAKATASASQTHRATRPCPGPAQHLCADHAHHALVHQTRLSASRP